MYNITGFASREDIEQIAETGFRILSDVGVLVEHEAMALLIQEYAPDEISYEDKRVRIGHRFAQDYFMSFVNRSAVGGCARGGSVHGDFVHCDFIHGSPCTKPPKPDVLAVAEIYEGHYLDPYYNVFEQWNQERFDSYIKLAKRLPNVGHASMLGCPLPQYPHNKKPLYEKLYAFKYGLSGASSIWDTKLCPTLYELWEIYAMERKLPIADVFCGQVYMISPLKMGYVECEHILYFREKSLVVTTGCLASIGLSAPVTPAGAIAMHFAEQLFISIMQAALFGKKSFEINSSLSVVDMRTGAFQYGRPEQLLINAAISDFADCYGIPYASHGGLSDAKMPSYEAGVQKISSALACIQKGRTGYIAAGLLAVDEVHSPIQMVLDNEAAGYLKRVCQGFAVGEDELALDAIASCIQEGGLFIEQAHTAEHMRECVWMPSVFSQEMFGAWHSGQRQSDIDRAKDIAMSIMEGPPLESQISDECEGKMRKVIGSLLS